MYSHALGHTYVRMHACTAHICTCMYVYMYKQDVIKKEKRKKKTYTTTDTYYQKDSRAIVKILFRVTRSNFPRINRFFFSISLLFFFSPFFFLL